MRDRERLADLSPGGAADHPIRVTSAALIEPRAVGTPCVQCGGEYRVREHASAGSGLREVEVSCRNCSARRTMWFKIVDDSPN